MLAGAALAALAGALAAPAAAREFDPVAGWNLNATPKTCTMSTTFTDDVTIGLVWAPSTSELGFMTAVPHSYDLGGRKTAPVVLSFDGHGPYNEWEDQRATVVNGNDSTGLIANWGAEHTDDLAKAVKAASHVTVRVAERDVGTYDLTGTKDAYQALLRCGRLIASK